MLKYRFSAAQEKQHRTEHTQLFGDPVATTFATAGVCSRRKDVAFFNVGLLS
jgi:hypothetical protein